MRGMFPHPTCPWGTPLASLWTEDSLETDLAQLSSFSVSSVLTTPFWSLYSPYPVLAPLSPSQLCFSSFIPSPSNLHPRDHLVSVPVSLWNRPGKLAFSSELYNPGDRFWSILLELSGSIWYSWHCILSGKALLPWLCGCMSYWLWYFTDPVFSVIFSDSPSSSPLQTQVLGAGGVWLCPFLFFPQKPFSSFCSFYSITLNFCLDHSYSSFKYTLGFSWKPLLSP